MNLHSTVYSTFYFAATDQYMKYIATLEGQVMQNRKGKKY